LLLVDTRHAARLCMLTKNESASREKTMTENAKFTPHHNDSRSR
jgi:hypothetical protein